MQKIDAFGQTLVGKNTLLLQLDTYFEVADYDKSVILTKNRINIGLTDVL
ncbi:MAG: hypothetical protein AB8B74_03050 [Crocinitomicaceae bacterium]